MVQGHNIVCIAPNPWDEIWRRRHHLMTRLARDNRVLWVEPPCFLPLSLLESVRRPSSRGILSQVRDNLFVYRLLHPLPFGESALRKGIGLIHRLNVWSCITQVKLAMRHLGFTSPLLWLYYTEISEDLIGRCGEKLTVCDVFDKYSAYSHYDAWGARRLEEREKRLLGKVDLVFTVSEQLCAYCKQFNETVFIVPNGVDITLWHDQAIDGTPLTNLRLLHPVLGYVGSIYDKVDFDLLLRISHAYPQASLLLIGPVKVMCAENQKLLSQLRSRPNVFFVGPKFYAELPAYYEIIDIALLPYASTEQVKYLFPTKLFEYMAARKLIVAMNTFAGEVFADIVSVARNKEQFVRCIGQLLTEDNSARVQLGYEIARQNSWDVRLERIGQIIESYLAPR